LKSIERIGRPKADHGSIAVLRNVIAVVRDSQSNDAVVDVARGQIGGPYDNYYIYMWVNKSTRVIETAWPRY
jgi:hypothetical protein